MEFSSNFVWVKCLKSSAKDSSGKYRSFFLARTWCAAWDLLQLSLPEASIPEGGGIALSCIVCSHFVTSFIQLKITLPRDSLLFAGHYNPWLALVPLKSGTILQKVNSLSFISFVCLHQCLLVSVQSLKFIWVSHALMNGCAIHPYCIIIKLQQNKI